MTAGWVAASTRSSALVRRLVGTASARELAGADTWSDALAELSTTFYGAELSADADRDAARRAATAATIWQLRVLAGWLPAGASGLARLFAAPIEIANIDAHLAGMSGANTSTPLSLGSLAVAWPRVAATTSPEQMRTVLAHSAWGDPGGADPVTVALGLRVAWARRLIRQVPRATPWARGGVAVLIARELYAFDRDIAPLAGREVDHLVGNHWRRATSIPELARLMPRSAGWALADIASPSQLWQAEVGVAHRVWADATVLAGARRFTKATVAAMMALLLIDLWRVTAAIELAGRGPNSAEVFDAVA